MHFTDEQIRGMFKSLRTNEHWECVREYLRRQILRKASLIPKDSNEAFYHMGFINGLNDIYSLMLEADKVESAKEKDTED